MANESGDMKLLGNFSKLIDFVSLDPNYNPANPFLKVPALTAQKDAGNTAITALNTETASYKVAVNERQAEFEDLRPLVPRAGNMLVASNAGKAIHDDFKTTSRKILGQRKAKKPKPGPTTAVTETAKTHSVSQQSYDNIAGSFLEIISLLATVPSYAPNEADLTIPGLQARAARLQTKNAAVSSRFASMSTARGLRDQLLYTNEDSIVNVALMVKAYVRAAFGPDSQLFKQIKGLQFKRPKG